MSELKHREHIANLPVLNEDLCDIFTYPRKKNIALALPVFNIGTDDIHEMYAKAAVWVGLRYILSTDVVEQGVPIYFLIGDKELHKTLIILDQARIPHNLRIICPQKDIVHFGIKWSGIFDEVFDDYDSVVVVDVDSYPFFVNEKYALFKDILDKCDLKDECIYAPAPYSKTSRPPHWAITHMKNFLGTEQLFWDNVEALYPNHDIKEKMLDPNIEVPDIGGWFVVFPKILRQNEMFRRTYFELARYSSLESTILEIYLIATNTLMKNYSPDTVWHFDKIKDKSTLSHIYTTNGFEWEKEWKQDCLDVLSWAVGQEKALDIFQR